MRHTDFMLGGWRSWSGRDALVFAVSGLVFFAGVSTLASGLDGAWHVVVLAMSGGIAAITVAALVAWGVTQFAQRNQTG